MEIEAIDAEALAELQRLARSAEVRSVAKASAIRTLERIARDGCRPGCRPDARMASDARDRLRGV
jgi:hypothetical protein